MTQLRHTRVGLYKASSIIYGKYLTFKNSCPYNYLQANLFASFCNKTFYQALLCQKQNGGILREVSLFTGVGKQNQTTREGVAKLLGGNQRGTNNFGLTMKGGLQLSISS